MMKAEDTVINKCGECGQIVSSQEFHPIECCNSFKAGVKEVVEWIEKHHIIQPCQYGVDHYDGEGNEVMIHQDPCHKCSWQAELKEWGIRSDQ